MKKMYLNITRKVLSFLAIFLLVFSLGFMLFVSFSPVKSVQLLKVMSGSMEPEIKTGSLVLVKSVIPSSLNEGDIITYTTNSPLSPVTHRVVSVENDNNSYKFITKGDANNNSDIDEIGEEQILGKVVTNAPYLGYISNWIKTPFGFILLIILPAIFIIISEIFSLRTSIKKEIDKKVQESKPLGILGIILFIGLISFVGISSTYAYFSDGMFLSNNTFATAENFPDLSPTPTPVISITPTPTITLTPTPQECGNSIVEQNSNTNVDINIDSSANTGNNNIENSSGAINTGDSETSVTVGVNGGENINNNCSEK